MRAFLFTAAAVLVLGFSACALADNPHGGNGNGGAGHWHGPGHSKHARAEIAYHDRVIIEDYLNQHERRKNCPPGLAKKHNGCLPPGIARKYTVGAPLPAGVRWSPVPQDLLAMLTPPPRGYRYVKVDHDVLLIGEATKKVIDAVELLSAVGHSP